MEKESLAKVLAEKSWFEARIEILACLGLMTFMFLMFLLIFGALMFTCCWLRRECDREKKERVEMRFGDVKKMGQSPVKH